MLRQGYIFIEIIGKSQLSGMFPLQEQLFLLLIILKNYFVKLH